MGLLFINQYFFWFVPFRSCIWILLRIHNVYIILYDVMLYLFQAFSPLEIFYVVWNRDLKSTGCHKWSSPTSIHSADFLWWYLNCFNFYIYVLKQIYRKKLQHQIFIVWGPRKSFRKYKINSGSFFFFINFQNNENVL